MVGAIGGSTGAAGAMGVYRYITIMDNVVAGVTGSSGHFHNILPPE
jgi:hypothetical protein